MLRIIILLSVLISSQALAAVSPWITFKNEYGHIVIPVEIAGIKTHAILDTGAQINGIDRGFLKKHKLKFKKGQKYRIEGVSSIESRRSYNGVPVGMFGAELKFDAVVEMDFSEESPLLIGAGFFESFIFQVDYPNNRMRLMSRDMMDLPKYQNIRFKAQKGSGRPMVNIKVGEKSVWGLLDTGSTAGILVDRKAASRIGLIDNETTQGYIQGVNDVAMTENTLAQGVQFGPYTLDNVPVTFPEKGESIEVTSQFSQSSSKLKGKKMEAIIGYEVFKHFLLTIDYKGGFMHVGLPEEG